MFAGNVFLIVWMIIRRDKIGAWLKPRPSKKDWLYLAGIVLLGTYAAIWLQQLAFQYSDVGIASTLLATAPLFALPIAALHKEKLSLRSILGVVIALAGVSLIFLAQ